MTNRCVPAWQVMVWPMGSLGGGKYSILFFVFVFFIRTRLYPHSLRGFISGTLGKKMGLTVSSVKGDDVRVEKFAPVSKIQWPFAFVHLHRSVPGTEPVTGGLDRYISSTFAVSGATSLKAAISARVFSFPSRSGSFPGVRRRASPHACAASL
jgi:hypothetical protein